MEIKKCRICKSNDLEVILDLGKQSYTGRFLDENEEDPSFEQLSIVQCNECGLIQLKDIFPPSEMYGETYGYRSSITKTMRDHLLGISEYAFSFLKKNTNLNIIDIGSNDGTLIGHFNKNKNNIIGIDPCINKHKENYDNNILLVNDFFSKKSILANTTTKSFDIITSIAMFYDLDDPIKFATDISELLRDKGIWITEQTYSHTLIESKCYDSICHEHVTYLALADIEKICEQTNLKILDISTNYINGGSFRLTIAKKNSDLTPNKNSIEDFRKKENILLNEKNVWKKFQKFVKDHKLELSEYLEDQYSKGKKILGYGASTKGNVLIQYCNITNKIMHAILERDERKFGKLTPASRIPIISEEEGRAMKPDILVVFPWHFKEEILKREEVFLKEGGTLVFPLPKIEIYTKDTICND